MKAYKVIGVEDNDVYYTTSYRKACVRLRENINTRILSAAKSELREELRDREYVKETAEHIERLIAFKNSEIGKMIENFCSQSTGKYIHTRWKANYDAEKLKEITKYLEEKGNEFGIHVQYYEPGGETFGVYGDDAFLISNPKNFYRFGVFDIDKDIEALRRDLHRAKGVLYYPQEMSNEDIIKAYIKKHYKSYAKNDFRYLIKEIEIE